MKIKAATFVMALLAGAALAGEEPEQRCPEWAIHPCALGPHHREAQRIWDPNLAQWRIEDPRRAWDANLARYRYESRHEVWDPYLAQYRPRDARRDPPPSRQRDGRHRHPGRQDWCFARH